MNIGIDARVLEKKMTGIGRYLLDILKAYALADFGTDVTLFSINKINYELFPFRESSYILVNSGSYNIPPKLFSPFWLNFVLPSLIEKNKIDIFFSPNHLLPFTKLKCRSVVVVHDLHHITNKNNHSFFYRNYLNFQLPYSVKNADVIVSISESTKKDLIDRFKIPPEKIKIIYRAADKKFIPLAVTDKERERLKLPNKFVLYVGVIENRKNIMGILKTADILYAKKPEIKFLLVGRPGYGFKVIEKEIIKKKNVIYLNYIAEQDIVFLYNSAFLFYFPSYNEGFGLPPLEAMQCGIPVLCSDIPALKEVVGDNGFLRHPDDHNGFAEDIMKLINDTNLYSEMKLRSLKQAKLFSADESLNKLVTVFKNLKSVH
jgi:glycosyltransferase involved in cell wall biosynthesis